jgi:hypothetical protein
MFIATSSFKVLRRPLGSAQCAAEDYRNKLAKHGLHGSMA